MSWSTVEKTKSTGKAISAITGADQATAASTHLILMQMGGLGGRSSTLADTT